MAIIYVDKLSQNIVCKDSKCEYTRGNGIVVFWWIPCAMEEDAIVRSQMMVVTLFAW